MNAAGIILCVRMRQVAYKRNTLIKFCSSRNADTYDMAQSPAGDILKEGFLTKQGQY